MKQYFTGFFTAVCLTISFFLFMGSNQKTLKGINNLGHIKVTGITIEGAFGSKDDTSSTMKKLGHTKTMITHNSYTIFREVGATPEYPFNPPIDGVRIMMDPEDGSQITVYARNGYDPSIQIGNDYSKEIGGYIRINRENWGKGLRLGYNSKLNGFGMSVYNTKRYTKGYYGTIADNKGSVILYDENGKRRVF